MQDTVLLTPASQVPQHAWNGSAGRWHELATGTEEAQPEALLWQVTQLDLEAPGPMLQHEDIDCILMLLGEAPLVLVDAERGTRKVLARGDRLYFAREVPYVAELPEGPVQCINLLFRRKVTHGCVDPRHGRQTLPLRPGETVLYCTRGGYTVDLPKRMGGPRTLQAGDVLQITLDYIPAFRVDITPLAPDARLIDARINRYPGT